MKLRFYSDTNQSLFTDILDEVGIGYRNEWVGEIELDTDDIPDWVRDQAIELGGEEIDDASDL